MENNLACNLLQSSNNCISKPHSWFLELLYLIINGSSQFRFNQIENTNLEVIPKTNSVRPNCAVQKFYFIEAAKSQKPRTLHLGCLVTRPSDRNFTRALGALAGMIWLIKAGKQTSHQNVSIHVTWRNTTWEQPTWLYRSSRCLMLLACCGWIKWWDHDGSGAVHNFKTQCWEHQYTYQNVLSKWHLSVTEMLNHLTNQAQISLHYECSRKTSTFQSYFKKTPVKKLFDSRFPMGVEVRGDLRPLDQMVLYQVHLNRGWAISSPACVPPAGPESGKDNKSSRTGVWQGGDTHGVHRRQKQRTTGAANRPGSPGGSRASVASSALNQTLDTRGWDWWVPEGTKLHSGCFILSYPTANRVCVFLPRHGFII